MSLFVAFFLPATVSLGVWQLNRAEQKIQVSEQMAQYDESLVSFTSLIADGTPVDDRWIGRKAELCVAFVGESWLLDNRTFDGNAGYDLYWPATHCQTDHPVLVRLGWLDAESSRNEIPELPEVPGDTMTLEAEVRPFPPDPFLSGPPEPLADGVWRFQSLGEPPDAEFGRSSGLVVQLVSPEALALPDNWDPLSVSPARHIAYAIQWFGLAVVLIIGFVVWGRHRFKISHSSE